MSVCTHLDEIQPGSSRAATAASNASSSACSGCTSGGARRAATSAAATTRPGKHATAHFHTEAHPIIQSFEPGEDWFYCYVDDIAFEIESTRAEPVAHLMRARLIVGVLMCVVGGVWFLQGIGVLKGSFMTGQGFWTLIGVILLGSGCE